MDVVSGVKPMLKRSSPMIANGKIFFKFYRFSIIIVFNIVRTSKARTRNGFMWIHPITHVICFNRNYNSVFISNLFKSTHRQEIIGNKTLE